MVATDEVDIDGVDEAAATVELGIGSVETGDTGEDETTTEDSLVLLLASGCVEIVDDESETIDDDWVDVVDETVGVPVVFTS